MTSLGAGDAFSHALRSDGTLWAWGSNTYGQLGDGTTTQRPSPVQVPFTGVVSIAGGYLHALAVRSDGTLWSWGTNAHGQLGNDPVRRSPVRLQFP